MSEARIISVFGAFNNRALVEMSADDAMELVGRDEIDVPRARSITAAELEVERIRELDPALADSLMAAAIVSLAYELDNPYNSATSKANCVGELRQTMNRLHELMPESQEQDVVDELREQRDKRRAGSAGA